MLNFFCLQILLKAHTIHICVADSIPSPDSLLHPQAQQNILDCPEGMGILQQQILFLWN